MTTADLPATLARTDMKLSNRIDTLPYERILEEETQDGYAAYEPTRVISPHTRVAVRSENPNGPRYQEAVGYTFLLYNAKFPGLTRMDGGRFALTLTAVLEPGDPFDPSNRKGLILFSEDEGKSWSQPARIPIQRTTPVNLGGSTLMLWGGIHAASERGDSEFLCLSRDCGTTWEEPLPIPRLSDGRRCLTDVAYHPLVEGDTVTFLFWTILPSRDEYLDLRTNEIYAQAVMRRYHVKSNTWDDPFFFPLDWRLSEGSLARASNGDLVAAFRTQPCRPVSNDSFEGMATTVSNDDGKSWSTPSHHFHYGRHHCSLENLSDGPILLTYLVRIGELDGLMHHGIEAVVSRDNGATWDWERRFILFRWPLGGMTHSPRSARLSDGRVFTVFMHDLNYTWNEHGAPIYPAGELPNLAFVGNVSAVMWRP